MAQSQVRAYDTEFISLSIKGRRDRNSCIKIVIVY